MLRKGISPEARVAKLTHGCDEEDFFFLKLTKKMMLIYITSADNNSFFRQVQIINWHK